MCVIAHHKVRKLIKGMAMIMCMEHLPIPSKTTKRVKNIMMNVGRNLLPTHMYQIDVTVSVVANDNVELDCTLSQKKVAEKAIPEIDKKLSAEMELRPHLPGRENVNLIEAIRLNQVWPGTRSLSSISLASFDNILLNQDTINVNHLWQLSNISVSVDLSYTTPISLILLKTMDKKLHL